MASVAGSSEGIIQFVNYNALAFVCFAVLDRRRARAIWFVFIWLAWPVWLVLFYHFGEGERKPRTDSQRNGNGEGKGKKKADRIM
jgi:hypothetical protein